ncbi:glycosyltransferase family 2 protein, partial [Acinetobacter baumannii]
RVSVVVPNFNYRRFLEARLRSIASQTLPPYEIIVLDDASTDGSMEELLRLQPLLSPELRIIKNHSNSGSVFRQWYAGVREAQGDYIWIA